MSKELSWFLFGFIPLVAIGLLLASLQMKGTVRFSAVSAEPNELGDRLYLEGTSTKSSQIVSGEVDIVVGHVVASYEAFMPMQPVVYNLFITNTSSITVSDIIVTDIVPSQIVSISILSTANGASITNLSLSPTYTWQIDNLAPQTRVVIYVVGFVDPTLNDDTAATNILTAFHPLDLVVENNTSTLALQLRVPEISFETSEIVLDEEDTVLHVNIVLTPTNAYGSATVGYATQPTDLGRASVESNGLSGPSDYAETSGTISFESAIQRTNGISVTLYNDHVAEGKEQFQLVLKNPLGAKLAANQTMTVTLNDDDTAGIGVAPQYLNLSEDGSSGEYTLVLNSQPLSPVHLNVQSLSQIIAEPSVVTFTAETWNIPQVVTAIAVDDSVTEGVHSSSINHQVHSADMMYDGFFVAPIWGGIVDNDKAGLQFVETDRMAPDIPSTATSTATYSVSLQSHPTENVTVFLSTNSETNILPNTLLFTPENWSESQLVTVFSMQDAPRGQIAILINHVLDSEDKIYGTIAPIDVPVMLKEIVRPGVRIITTPVSITVDGPESTVYAVTLTSIPTADVTVKIHGDERIVVNPPEVFFDATNWNQPQPLTLSRTQPSYVGVQDGVIAVSTQSGDQEYADLPPLTVTVQVGDENRSIYLPLIEGN